MAYQKRSQDKSQVSAITQLENASAVGLMHDIKFPTNGQNGNARNWKFSLFFVRIAKKYTCFWYSQEYWLIDLENLGSNGKVQPNFLPFPRENILHICDCHFVKFTGN
jgi:hypothetical protein